jgi:hypothetical protein
MTIAVLNDPSEKPDSLTNFHGREPHPSMPARKDIAKGLLLIGERARILLGEGRCSITEIAMMTGFSSPSHLAFHVRRMLRLSPREVLGVLS